MERRNFGTANNNGDQNRRHGGGGSGSTYINNTRINVSSSMVFFLPGPGSFDITLRQGQPPSLASQRSEHRREQTREQRRGQMQVQQMTQHFAMGSDLQRDRRMSAGSAGYSAQQSPLPTAGLDTNGGRFTPLSGATSTRVMNSSSSTPSTPRAPASTPPNPCYAYDEDEELVLPDGFTLSPSDC